VTEDMHPLAESCCAQPWLILDSWCRDVWEKECKFVIEIHRVFWQLALRVAKRLL
jgi:hypothetical protein